MNNDSARDYVNSHPWLSFDLNLKAAPYTLWLHLGECKALCDRLCSVALPPSIADELHEVYLAKGANATTAIEGNSLSEEQVQQIIQGKLKLPPSKKYLEMEVQNVLDCFDRVLDMVRSGLPTHLTASIIREFNRQILGELELPDEVVPGETRGHMVVVGRYRGAPVSDCDYLIERLCDWINGPSFQAPSADMRIPMGILKAIVAHVYFEWVHPFADGNGRTGRMIEFLLLVDSGIPTPAAHLLSNHYNQTRTKYIFELEKASKKQTLNDFLCYAVQGLVDGLREQMERLTAFQMSVTWEHFVYHYFRHDKEASKTRRRDVLLALAQHGPTEKADIPRLNRKLQSEYSDKTLKTITRDLNYLENERLVVHDGDRWGANFDRVLSFLPLRKSEHEEPAMPGAAVRHASSTPLPG